MPGIISLWQSQYTDCSVNTVSGFFTDAYPDGSNPPFLIHIQATKLESEQNQEDQCTYPEKDGDYPQCIMPELPRSCCFHNRNKRFIQLLNQIIIKVRADNSL